jgi:hypothetical protein
MHITRSDADIAMPGGFHDLCQGPATSQRVTNEGVPAVMNREVSETARTKASACCPEAFPQDVATHALPKRRG